MLLIFGIRASATVLLTLRYVCEHCGIDAAHRLVRRVRRFTLFFVPLFPVGGTRYEDTCTACGRVREVSREQADQAVASAGARG